MNPISFSLSAEVAEKARTLCESLLTDSRAQTVLLVDVHGRVLSRTGHEPQRLDTVALGALAAASIAANRGLAQLVGESDFSHVTHEGEHENLHMSVLDQSAILIVLFDARTDVQKVRKTARLAHQALHPLVTQAETKSGQTPAPFANLNEQELDNLLR